MSAFQKIYSLKNINSLSWGLFFVTLFLPIQIQIEESASFWSGVFLPFSTVFWWGSFFLLATSLFLTGVQIFQNTDLKKISLPSFPVTLWLLFFLWGSIQSFHFFETWQLSFWFLSQWLLLGLLVWLVASGFISLRHIVIVFVGVAIVQTLLALWQTLPGFFINIDYAVGSPILRSDEGEILRATGTFLHPNILGFFLVATFFLGEILGNSWRKWRLFLLFGILCTFSRSALLALCVGQILSYFANMDRGKLQVKSEKLKVLQRISEKNEGASLQEDRRSSFGGVVFIFCICTLGVYVRQSFDTLSPSNFERMSQIQISLQMIQENWLWGVGSSNFPIEMAKFDIFFPWQLQPVHNLFLLIGSEMGIIAMGIMGMLFIWMGWRVFHMQNKSLKPLVASLFSIIFVFAMFEHLLITSLLGLVIISVGGGLLFSQKNY